MIELPGSPQPYHVSCSGRVLDDLRALVARARQRGFGPEVIAALETIDYQLRIYPHFGQPLRDLTAESGQVWVGVVPPLVVRYVVFEDRRVVSVVEPMKPLPRSGF